MTISTVELWAYSLPLVQPWRADGALVERREGWLVRLVCGGAEGWGEAAPLAGFSRERAADALRDLRHAVAAWPGRALPGLDEEPSGYVSSVRFALSCAAWACRAQVEGVSPAALWSGRDVLACPLNALAHGSEQQVAGQAGEAANAGFSAIKLKVGREAPATDAARIRAVAAALRPGMRLRLDANRQWTLEQAREVARAVGEVPVEYAEEPLRAGEELSSFTQATGWNLALDESLVEADPDAPPVIPGVVAWVLKPTINGGLVRTRRWVEAAQRAGVRAMISSSWESGVGLRALGELAAAVGGEPAGLDTYRGLGADVLTPRLAMDGGRLDLVAARRAAVSTARLLRLA